MNNNGGSNGIIDKIKKKNLTKIAQYITSITKTFSGTGTPKDWINTAIIIVPAIFISLIIIFILLYVIVMAPVAAIQEGIHKISGTVENVGEWFSKLGNWFTGYGWVGDEAKFGLALKETYEKYEKKGICIDDTAISAVLIYKYAISSDVDAGNDEDVEEENTTVNEEDIDYDEMTSKIKKLAKAQIYNNQISNADFLAFLREGKKATDEQRREMNVVNSSSGSSFSSDGIVVSGKKYNLTDDEIMGLAALAYQEQGSINGAKAEASLMANQYELNLNNEQTRFSSLYEYVRDSGWFYGSKEYMNNTVGTDIFNSVKEVLVEGKRTLPLYINEHDYIGDIGSVTNNGVAIDKYDYDSYQKDVTIIHQNSNIPGAGSWKFYTFPEKNSDPFGYTEAAYAKMGGNADGTSTDATNAPEYTDAPISTQANVTIINDIPDGLGKVHTYTVWDDWDWSYDAGDVIKQLGGQNHVGGGYVGSNDYGIVTYGQWYAGATTTTFGKVGDMIFFIQDDGSVYPLIVADEKSQQYVAWDHNPANKWGHDNGLNIVEFEVMSGSQAASSGGNVPGPNNEFDHYITSAVNVGNVYDNPEFINNVQAALKAANLDGATFIDVGSVTTSGFNANGISGKGSYTCPGDLVYYKPTNEDLDSMEYEKGFIYKYYKDYFKNYEGKDINYTVEKLIKEIYEYKDSLTSVMEKTTKTGNYSGTLACNITGDFQSWKQGDPKWGSISLGNSSHTIASAGCMVTSIAMQIMKSGTQLNVLDFNPGVFVETLNSNGGFVGALFANNQDSWSSIAPNFKIVETNVPLTGSREDKTNKLKELAAKGYYVIFTVKANQGHWVALDRVEGDTVYIMDPASDKTKLWDEIYEVGNTNSYTLFKADDSAATTISSSGVCSSASGEYKYYNQAAGDGSDGIHYGSYSPSCRSNTNLNAIGCSQMSIAIVASGVVSSDITPITVADAYCEVGINHAVSFSDIVQESLMQKLGMIATPLFSESDSRETKKEKLQDILNKGYPVIINVTSHYIAVVPGNGGSVKLMDPGSIEKTKEYSMEDFDKVTWHGSTLWKSAYYYSKRS